MKPTGDHQILMDRFAIEDCDGLGNTNMNHGAAFVAVRLKVSTMSQSITFDVSHRRVQQIVEIESCVF